MRRELSIIALGLPLVTIVTGIVRAELHFARSEDFTFDVEGYDPRDILRGQYIQYRVAWHEAPPGNGCTNGEESCCLCLTDHGPGAVASVVRSDCAEARRDCDGVLHTRHLSSLQRYYIPEARARELQAALPAPGTPNADSARIVLAIDGEGKPQVKALLVGGKPIVGKSNAR